MIRLSSSYKEIQAINSNDSILNYNFGTISKKVRVITIELPDGTMEMLATNIFYKSINTTLFKELYFLRWGVECKYKELKSSIEIEEFSGTKPIAIEQDCYAYIYLSMIVSLIKKEADAAIADDNQNKILKSEYQANENFILSEVFKKIITMMVKPILRKRILENLLEKAKKIRSQIRPNRSCERKNKHPKKKHHSQRKSCI